MLCLLVPLPLITERNQKHVHQQIWPIQVIKSPTPPEVVYLKQPEGEEVSPRSKGEGKNVPTADLQILRKRDQQEEPTQPLPTGKSLH